MSDDLEALKVTASIDKTTSMLRRYNITKGRGGYPQSLELYAVQNVLDALADALAEVKRLRAAIQPFAEPHMMGDNYVKFAPRLIEAARAALAQQSQAGGGE